MAGRRGAVWGGKGDDNFRGPPIGKLTGVTSVFPCIEKNSFSIFPLCSENLHHAAVLFEAASTSNVNTIVLPSPLSVPLHAVVLTTLSCR